MCDVRVDLIVKFGGSAVTDKKSFETLQPEIISDLAKCIKNCHEAGLTCIVVHGAGSFGHHQAKQYAINQGLCERSTKEEHDLKMMGFSIVRESVLKLNQAVVSSLINMSVPAVSFSPASSWEVQSRQPKKWPYEILQEYLKHRIVPVFHGDCCLDSDLVCSILSGDTIIKIICSMFPVQKVVFITDVAGIYDKPPNFPDAKLLTTIQVDTLGEIKDSIITSDSVNDVTGGMKLKLQAGIDIVVCTKGQCPVYIVGYKSSCLLDLLLDRYPESWNVTSIVMSDNI
ncbi:hypothetical protein Btru_003543 [Bulinus truncatus]|nr:hypothetical protein Btru_003543 [Bulinus truncatus]